MTAILDATMEAIRPADAAAERAARAHLDALTKPRGALGELETLAARLAAIRGGTPTVAKKSLVIFAADHGVARRGVSAYPPEVTAQMLRNFERGGAAANVLARQLGATVTVVDAGVGAGRATRDLCVDSAMTPEECKRAIATGVELATSGDADLLIAGEMGIGNTTAAAAMFCALFDLRAAEVAGRGTGVDDDALQRKIAAIELALQRHGASRDPLHILTSLGGHEIAAITGFALGAAARRRPLLVDGFIATAGVAVAMRLHEHVRDYLFFAHRSGERAHDSVLRRLGVTPLLDLRLRLGEGTGALLAAHLLEAACRIYSEMATFDSAGVSGPA